MSLIIKPVITEKSLAQAAQGIYTFHAPMAANKLMVAQAVTELFSVEVSTVRISIQKGKIKTYKSIKGRRADRKKAYVQLAPGQKIAAFDMGQEPEADKKADKPAKTKKEAK